MTERTDEQKVADAALASAIEAVVTAYFPTEDMRVIEEFIVVMAITEFNEGEPTNGTMEIFRDGSIPTWKALGLLTSVKARLENGEI